MKISILKNNYSSENVHNISVEFLTNSKQNYFKIQATGVTASYVESY